MNVKLSEPMTWVFTSRVSSWRRSRSLAFADLRRSSSFCFCSTSLSCLSIQNCSSSWRFCNIIIIIINSVIPSLNSLICADVPLRNYSVIHSYLHAPGTRNPLTLDFVILLFKDTGTYRPISMSFNVAWERFTTAAVSAFSLLSCLNVYCIRVCFYSFESK